MRIAVHATAALFLSLSIGVCWCLLVTLVMPLAEIFLIFGKVRKASGMLGWGEVEVWTGE
jgi:hypothetical protein